MERVTDQGTIVTSLYKRYGNLFNCYLDDHMTRVYKHKQFDSDHIQAFISV